MNTVLEALSADTKDLQQETRKVAKEEKQKFRKKFGPDFISKICKLADRSAGDSDDLNGDEQHLDDDSADEDTAHLIRRKIVSRKRVSPQKRKLTSRLVRNKQPLVTNNGYEKKPR